MTAFPQLDETLLKTEVEACLQGECINLSYMQSCASTNLECLQRARHGTVVVAEQQTAGRGRRGKTWFSPHCSNIYCSIGVNKTLPPTHLGLLSIVVGVSIAQVLTECGFAEVSLKWPNDILYLGKKLGGILIETRALGDDDFFLVIGFGLNMNLDEAFRQQIDQPTTGLNHIKQHAVERQQLLPMFISRIMQGIKEFEIDSASALFEAFHGFDALRGRQVRVTTAKETITGTYQGLESTGQVQVETEQGLRSYAAAEISLRGA